MWTQIIGKIRLRKMPWLNHSWHVTLYVSPLGLTTGSVPYEDGIFQIELDFKTSRLTITTDSGTMAEMELGNCTIAGFYNELLSKLQGLGIEVEIYAKPNEMESAIPFAEDHAPRHYNIEQINRYHRALVLVHKVFVQFRAGFTGKCSPVHLFWGAFDLAVTRFSGRLAPLHSGGAPNMPLRVMQEAYSHEVSSSGFWPGSDDSPMPVFYSYCYPAPAAFGKQKVAPAEAFYSGEMGEFLLPYDTVRQAAAPEAMLLQFLETTYKAAALTANWDCAALECDLTRYEHTEK
jgi:hypothetical protein